jgi:GTP-binding protein
VEKPVLYAVNKIDGYDKEVNLYDFHSLGIESLFPISAEHNYGVPDFLDELVKYFPRSSEPDDMADDPDSRINRIAVVGRPNVGKSSLINRILGEDRQIVSDIPGTTRDAIDTWFEREGKSFLLVDTAGIRRKSRIEESTERYSVIRALKAIDRCDVSLVMLDALAGVTEQDKHIAGYVHEKGKASVLVVNKWDLVEKDEHTGSRYRELIQQELAFMDYAPVALVSARTKKRVHHLLGLVEDVWEEYNHRISTGSLNSLLRELQLRNPPPTRKGKKLTILYATQGGVRPPTFVLFVNAPEIMHFSYLRYLENQLRQAYGFKGTPVRLVLRKRLREGRSL